MKEIEESIAQSDTEETVAMNHANKSDAPGEAWGTTVPYKKTSKGEAPKPLAGVRIKRKYKNRLRRTR